MAVWSEVNTSDVFGAIRLDAEFYQPHYQNNEAMLRAFGRLTTLGEATSKFVKGIFDINADEYTQEGVPFVRISNLRDMFISDHNLAFISRERHLDAQKTALRKFDVVISKTAVPAASLVQFEECNTSQDIIAVQTTRGAQFNFYLVAFLNSCFGLRQMERLFQGNIQSHLSLDEARTILVPLPGESFEREITDLMNESLRTREQASRLYAEGEALLLSELGLNNLDATKALTYEADFQKVATAGRFDTEFFQPRYARVREALAKLPNCKVIPLEDIITELTNGQTPLRHDLSVGEVPFLTAEHVADFRIDFASDKRVLTEHHLGLLKRTQLKPDDVLITIKGRIGNVAVVEQLPGPVNINQDVGLIRLKEEIPPYYLAGFLNSLAGKLLTEQVCTGQINPFLGLGNLKTVPVPIFSLREMQRLAQSVKDKIGEALASAQDAQNLIEAAKRKVEEMIEGGM